LENGLRRASSAFAFLTFAAIGLWAQDGVRLDLNYHQTPDKDGIYCVGPEVRAPRLVSTVYVPYPYGVSNKGLRGMTVMAMVINAKGVPEHIQLLLHHGDLFDRAAISAVQHSTFAPGMLGEKPVPVWIDVRVVFKADRSDTTPQVLITERDLPAPIESELEDKHHKPRSYTPPFPIHTVDADFVDPFVKTPYIQVAVVSVLVSDEGMPTDVRVVRGLGFGLDEKAAAAVWHYRFFPATKKGKPVSARRNVLVDFVKF
jgi:TonB family protein